MSSLKIHKSKHKSKKIDIPRFEFEVYESNLDPVYKDFLNIVRMAADCVANKPEFRKRIYDRANLDPAYHQFLNYKPDTSEQYIIIRSSIEDFISRRMFKYIRSMDKFQYPCMFQLQHHAGFIFRVKVSSLKVKKSSRFIAYFPNTSVVFSSKGIDYELGFTKHAIDRYFERCIVDESSYSDSQFFFHYVNHNLYIEKVNDYMSALYRPLSPEIELDNFFIKVYSENKNTEHYKYEYFLKVGYAPLHFDFERMSTKCKTVLLPGMRNTPENIIFQNNDGSRKPSELADLKIKFDNMCSNANFQDIRRKYLFQYYCHRVGFHQFFGRKRIGSIVDAGNAKRIQYAKIHDRLYKDLFSQLPHFRQYIDI